MINTQALAERSLLGTVVASQGRVLDHPAVKALDDEVYTHPGRRVLWQAMRELWRDSKPVDGVLLLEQLNGRGTPPVVVELSECTASAGSEESVEHYANIVAEAAKDRRIRSALAELAGDATRDSSSILEGLRSLIGDMAKAAEEPRIRWIDTSSVFEPLPPTRWLFRELGICPGRPSMIAGYGYSGKTLAGQALLLAAASGRDAWGYFPTGKPLSVLHFDFEQGRHATLKRYQRLAAGVGLAAQDIEPRLRVAIFPPAYLNAPDAASVYARETEGADLVLLDSLAGSTPGVPENESTMRAFLDLLGRVSEMNGTTFIVIHHAGKPREAHDKDPRTILRGHSSIFDACGNVLVFSGEKNKPILVRQVKAPAEAEGAAIDPFCLQIEDVPGDEWMPDGVRILRRPAETDGPEDPVDVAEARRARVAARVQAAVPDAAQKIWKELRGAVPRSIRTRPQLLDLLPGAENAVRSAAVTYLQKSGRIVLVRGSGKGEGQWYEAQGFPCD